MEILNHFKEKILVKHTTFSNWAPIICQIFVRKNSLQMFISDLHCFNMFQFIYSLSFFRCIKNKNDENVEQICKDIKMLQLRIPENSFCLQQKTDRNALIINNPSTN